MKKNIGILFFSITLVLFSSCVVVHTRHDPEDYIPVPVVQKYSITFKNNTYDNITDWYVENRAGTNFEKSSNFVPVRSGNQSTIHNLIKNDYRVVFSYRPIPDINDYYCSAFTYLDEDIEYKLYEDNFYSRSQGTSSGAPFYLMDSNGNKIELYKLEN